MNEDEGMVKIRVKNFQIRGTSACISFNIISVVRFLQNGKVDPENRPHPYLAFHRDGAAVHFRDPTGDGQTQTSPGRFAGTRAVCAHEALKNRRKIRLRKFRCPCRARVITACARSRDSSISQWPPGGVYFTALSTKIRRSRSIAMASALTHTGSAGVRTVTWSGLSADRTAARSLALQTYFPRSTSCMVMAAALASALASVRRFSSSSEVSTEVSKILDRALRYSPSVRRLLKVISAVARITATGVRRSWDASAVNCVMRFTERLDAREHGVEGFRQVPQFIAGLGDFQAARKILRANGFARSQ